MSLAAYQAAVGSIAGAISTLPLRLYERTISGGSTEVFNHPATYLLNTEANPDSTATVFIDCLVRSIARGGNGYAEIVPARNGEPRAVFFVERERTRPGRLASESGSLRHRDGQLVYMVDPPDTTGETKPLFREEMLHIPWVAPTGSVGVSPLTYHYATVVMGLSVDEFCKAFFLNGQVSGYIQLTDLHKGINNKSYQRLVSRFAGAIGPANSRQIGTLEEGASFHELGGKPEDAQLLDTRSFQVEEVARCFNIDPLRLRSRQGQTHGNAEASAVDFVTITLPPWVSRLEEEYTRKLLTRPQRRKMYFRHDLDSLLRGAPMQRARVYAVHRQNGTMSRNDVRRSEHWPLIPAEEGGDDYSPSQYPRRNFGIGQGGDEKGAEKVKKTPTKKDALKAAMDAFEDLEPALEVAGERVSKSISGRVAKAARRYLPENKEGFQAEMVESVSRHQSFALAIYRPLLRAALGSSARMLSLPVAVDGVDGLVEHLPLGLKAKGGEVGSLIGGDAVDSREKVIAAVAAWAPPMIATEPMFEAVVRSLLPHVRKEN